MGAFCEVYGDQLPNRLLEFLLEKGELDTAVGDMARETGMSRPTAYEIISGFVKKGIAMKTRQVGKTQLYKLNASDSRVKLYQRDFKECLRLVCEEYDEKGNHKQSQRVKSEVLKAQ